MGDEGAVTGDAGATGGGTVGASVIAVGAVQGGRRELWRTVGRSSSDHLDARTPSLRGSNIGRAGAFAMSYAPVPLARNYALTGDYATEAPP